MFETDYRFYLRFDGKILMEKQAYNLLQETNKIALTT